MNEKYAHSSLLKWIQSGRELQIRELDEALKTFENWCTEISNYHKCRFTNVTVEGRRSIKTMTADPSTTLLVTEGLSIQQPKAVKSAQIGDT